MDQRIVSAIDRQLARKGLVKATIEGGPDLFVEYHASFDRDLQIKGFGSGRGGYGFGATRSAMARAEEILVGAIGCGRVRSGAGGCDRVRAGAIGCGRARAGAIGCGLDRIKKGVDRGV